MSEKELEALLTRLKIELEKIKKNEERNKRFDASKKRELVNDIARLEKGLL
ncbi:MAG: hypothetical protein VX028_00835 [Nanoarchaeota archaeon]|nr:hypothetical protein [Nanoarchaeota archaeon]MEC8339325.1 hypothetical protein [Nanoarchaeota archaeon]